MTIFFIIFFQVCLNTFAQVLLKSGVNKISFEQHIFDLSLSIATNISILSGVSLFVVSLLIWLYLLSRCELSYLYPFGSISYILAALAGWCFFGEHVSALRLVGIIVIFLGVCCVAKS